MEVIGEVDQLGRLEWNVRMHGSRLDQFKFRRSCDKYQKNIVEKVSAMSYRAVVQAVLIFGVETWVFPAAMYRNLEGVHVGFLRNIMGQKEKRQRDGTWRSKAEANVIKEAGTQTLGTCIEKR